jgi:hypothetical protein
MTLSIPIKALVHANERSAITTMAGRLQERLTQAAAEPAAVTCSFAESFAELQKSHEPSIIVTSLLLETDNHQEDWVELEGRLRARYAALAEDAASIVFVTTVFRHVSDGDAAHREQLRLRIRRLNRLAADLSREYGIMVVDLDRDLADIGGRRLQTDYRLDGEHAGQVAARSMARAIVSAGLDNYVPFEVQVQVQEALAQEQLSFSAPVATEVAPSNVLVLKSGRQKQVVKTIVSTSSESHAGWLFYLLLSGKYSFKDAFLKLKGSVARRGLRASIMMILAAAKAAPIASKKSSH